MSINAQPFQPQFKLIGNLAEDQVLVYDTSEGAFVNSAGSGGGGAAGFTAIENVGSTGTAIHYGEAGTTLQLKKLIGGDNLTITDNGTGGLILAATNTDTIQDGTNVGTGTGLFHSKDNTTHALKFKSLAVGAGLTLTDDGNGTITLVNTVSGGGSAGADGTLSNLSNVATARTNLDVFSKAEGDARYHDKFSNFLPSANNVYDVGSPSFKFNDIYAETFQGTAVLAENLAISGTAGQVLTYNGSAWVAADNAGGGGGGGGGSVPQSLSISGSDLTISSGNTVDLSTLPGLGFNGTFTALTGKPTTLAGYGITDALALGTTSTTALAGNTVIPTAVSQLTNDSNYLSSVPAQLFSSLVGKPTTLAGYGITDGGGSYANSNVDTHLNVSSATANQVLKWTGTDYAWVTSTDSDTTYTAGTGLTLSGTEFSLTSGHFDGDYNSLSNKPNLFDGTYSSLSGKPTLFSGSYNDLSAKPTLFDGAYSSLSGRPTLFDGAYSSLTSKPTTLAGYGITDSFDNADIDTHLNTGTATANQVLKWTGTDYDWVTSTDSDTTYTAGTGLTLSGTEFSLTGGHYNDSAVDTHLNISGATANQMLKWTGTDYAWVTSTDSDTTYTAGSGLTLSGTEFSLTGGAVTPSSATAFTNKTGNISQWTNDAGYLTSETDSQTLSLSGTTLSISTGNNVDLGALTLDDFADVAISSVSDGQFLTYDNGTGDWTNSTVSIPTLTSQLTNDAGFITSASTYDNSDVDSHLNQSNPTSGYVLSWNGSDYAWVSNGASGAHYTDSDARAAFSATTGLSYNSGTGVFSLNSQLENLSDVSSTTPSTGQVLKWNGSTWTPSADENDDTIYTSFNTDFDTRLSGKSTTNLSEGTNKYFTDTRVRNAISVTGDLSYNASTGVISFTETDNYANADVDTHLNSGSATTGQILSWNGSDYDWIANSGTPAWSAVTNKPTTISGFGITDAFDGAYSSLSGKPTLPTNVSDLTNDSGFLTSVPAQTFASLTSKPTTIAGYGITDSVTPTSSHTFTNKSGNISQWTNNAGYLTSVPAQSFASLTGKPTSIAGYGITDSFFSGAYADLSGKPTLFDGAYSSLSGAPTMYANSNVDAHLNQSNPTSGYVLSWNGSDYAWVAQSGGGAGGDKIEEGNSSVEVIDGGADGRVVFETNGTDRWQISNSGHILPESNATYDLGSNANRARNVYLNTSLYIGTDIVAVSGGKLTFNGSDVQDYNNLSNKPDAISAGSGIQLNSGTLSLSSALSGLTDVSSSAPSTGQVLKWNGSAWAPGTDVASGTAAMNDLTDVSTSGISSGQYLSWNGSSFVATTPSSGGASAINDLSDVDTSTSAPSNGDVLTWVQADSEWAPAAPSGGGGGSGATIEYFKLNYATNGNLSSITNATSGVSASILSATGGDVEVSFSSTNYPPSGIIIYGYAYSTNEYNIKNAHADMNTRKMSGGGSAGSPIAFGSMGSVDLTLDLREASTGAGRSFGTTTHAWVMFTTV